MKVAVVGATGMVGQVMIQMLEERNFPVTELIPVASAKSVGKEVHFKGEPHILVGIDQAVALQPDIAIFSAGGDISKSYAPKFAAQGTTVIDNSSAWRMEAGVPLIIPEINADTLTPEDKIIANPNCSTIQLLMVLHPLNIKYQINRVVLSTYQSITGTGVAAVQQMEQERTGESVDKVYPHAIDKNCLPHCDVFLDNGYTKEEMKLTQETIKILNDPKVKVAATAVRVPVVGGHSESVNITFDQDYELAEVGSLLASTSGVEVVDNPADNEYPMPIDAHGKDDVFVGRIRRDFTLDNSLNLWIVADNIRKGAATNAIQIGEFLVAKGWV